MLLRQIASKYFSFFFFHFSPSSYQLGCNYIGDEGVSLITDALTTNIEGSALVWLGLGNNHIGDKGAESLADLLSSGMTSIDEDEGEEGTACTLTTLGLGGNEITDLGVVQLAQALDRNEG